ncbi:hypothetical protein NP284_08075, partial [Rhodopseudomonas pseudopalustris]|uniref:hypothetical protein n=1 Tax=Rhodopseudomonas pseudopalustris TaxID=1513892 RepID=UPI003F97CCC0
AACDGKRPKSREETPKEGSDSASATAPQQYAAATHKAQVFLSIFPCKKRRSGTGSAPRAHDLFVPNQ